MHAYRCPKCIDESIPIVKTLETQDGIAAGSIDLIKSSCPSCDHQPAPEELLAAENQNDLCLKDFEKMDTSNTASNLIIQRELVIKYNAQLAPCNFYWSAMASAYIEGFRTSPDLPFSPEETRYAVYIAEASLSAARSFLSSFHFYLFVKLVQFLRFVKKVGAFQANSSALTQPMKEKMLKDVREARDILFMYKFDKCNLAKELDVYSNLLRKSL